MNTKYRWLVVILFAAAMAWVEAAVVLYLRILIDRIQPYQPNPLPASLGLARAELIREASTIVMLWAVGWLAGTDMRTRLGYALMAFGAWDILYYIFLAPLSGWPQSPVDWDILFLIPVPWWGPVLAPVSIAALMVLAGTLITQFQRSCQSLWPHRTAWLASLGGACLALYIFMRDALHVFTAGTGAVRDVLPVSFNWTLFAVAYIFMSVPVIELICQRWVIPPPRFRLENKHGPAAGAD